MNESKKFTQQELDAVFHAYDIRGTVPNQLNQEFFYVLGKAYTTFLQAKKIAVGYDIRPESKEFQEAFMQGAAECGSVVVDIGMIPSEMIYFVTGSDETFDGAVTITASHNPAGWNGCKLCRKSAQVIGKESGLLQIKELMLANTFDVSLDRGEIFSQDFYPAFKTKIRSLVTQTPQKKLKILVDAGNGIGGKVFDYIFGDINFEIERMYFEPDGTFPNHVPDPLKEENVLEIKAKMKNGDYDIGIAIDGDADRVFFIDKLGRNPSGIYTGAIIAKRFLAKNPGSKIIHDPRIIWPIQKKVEIAGGIPIISKAGHSYFKDAMRTHGALFGAEMSSHLFYKDFYNADSGMYTIALILQHMLDGMQFEKELDDLYSNFPNSGEVNFTVSNNQEVLERVKHHFKDGKIEELDGVSISYPTWRFNLRSSNTQPLMRLCVEATNIEDIVTHFKEIKLLIDGKQENIPSLKQLQ